MSVSAVIAVASAAAASAEAPPGGRAGAAARAPEPPSQLRDLDDGEFLGSPYRGNSCHKEGDCQQAARSIRSFTR